MPVPVREKTVKTYDSSLKGDGTVIFMVHCDLTMFFFIDYVKNDYESLPKRVNRIKLSTLFSAYLVSSIKFVLFSS